MTMDKLHKGLTELCFAINYCTTISVWEAGDTAGKGPGKGGSRTRNRKGYQDQDGIGDRMTSDQTIGNQMIAKFYSYR